LLYNAEYRVQPKAIVKYVSPREAADYFDVSLHTLRRWEERGWIKAMRTPSGRERRYDLDSYVKAQTKAATTIILYARVSSHAQKPDLDRQVAKLVELYPSAEVISEVGGGLNFKRKKLIALLERVLQRDIATIVVAHKDRLCRFGFDLVKWLCEKHGCQILVLNETSLSPAEELVEDVLAIVHCFSSRLYGLRKYKSQMQEDKDLPRRKSS
jgi:predicted site-specific integrase-resolvase